jgi:ribose 5-phosphate isomerase B
MSAKVYVASDHNGNAARAYIMKLCYDLMGDAVDRLEDLGPGYDEGKVDYVDYAKKLCMKLKEEPESVGILVCGTGTGMCIAANRFPWIRAGLATDRATASLMREHNNANVLVLGQWRTPLGAMDEIVYTFLTTEFEGGRHIARLEKLAKLL